MVLDYGTLPGQERLAKVPQRDDFDGNHGHTATVPGSQ
jgi:hypothetical protein